jgi:hypothetical protein
MQALCNHVITHARVGLFSLYAYTENLSAFVENNENLSATCIHVDMHIGVQGEPHLS